MLAAVLLVSGVGMASAQPSSLTWYLTDRAESPSVSGAHYIMMRDNGTGTHDVGIPFGGRRVWIAATSGGANQPAIVTAVEMSGIWTGKLKGANAGDPATLYIGILNTTTGIFTTKGHQTFTFAREPKIYDISITTTRFTIPKDDYLAVNISSPSTVTIFTTGDPNSATFITSPHTTDPYPVSELPTIILMCAGLLALAGFVLYRRRNNI